jgi:hypothetical protein
LRRYIKNFHGDTSSILGHPLTFPVKNISNQQTLHEYNENNFPRGKSGLYNNASVNAVFLLIMKNIIVRLAFGITVAASLAACGSGVQDDHPLQTAATVQMDVQAVPVAVSANAPLPDCAPEGCKGLRIIDGNAEAFRYEAMRRAETASL